jgi:hypothetical protein
MVPTSSVEILVSVKVLKLKPEITTIEKTSTPKLDTEDATLVLPIFSNVESMVDQTTMTRAPTLMSNVQVNHG